MVAIRWDVSVNGVHECKQGASVHQNMFKGAP